MVTSSSSPYFEQPTHSNYSPPSGPTFHVAVYRRGLHGNHLTTRSPRHAKSWPNMLPYQEPFDQPSKKKPALRR
ncbi:hypothetical protein K437DRAFT_257321 [Tilletiaria anomala UBC 951]|uniref:Uncharacterized protein n=1 Tax=Tilletiaria anomala (strain ATCC 24038 / CBS 436.72 / UBC 951) TaxID=1037660 RepID=A0A066VYP3_TILAU|nr:uncharacterized protein K437DRAFT_257321 [Tilletiaria anomala UBC 951]KDN43924.1 hypothetical protein K437DRAFT_257321 [Tilletiaria anomala UBC 951]